MVDWNQVLDEQEKAAGDGSIPDGKYPIRVESAEATKAGTGNPMLKLVCKVVGGPYDGRPVWTNIVFAFDNPVAMKFTYRKLAGLGIDREVLRAQNPSFEQIAKMITGAEAEAEIIAKTWNDEPGNDIKGFKGAVASASAPKPAGVPDIPIPKPPDPQSVAAETPPTKSDVPDIPIPPPPAENDEEPF